MAKQYDNWEVVRSLGEGGQAHVFQVRNIDDPEGRDYALKRLRNTARIERFKREMDAAKKLTSNYIVKISAHNLDGDKPYYVMPYYPRGNAADVGLPDQGIPVCLEFFEHVLEGMSSAHSADPPIVHRDLKPENILVTGDWAPVIIDFGICFIEDGNRLTMTDERVGNQDFSAPEVLHGREQDVGPQSDVYSLGKILYWLLTGRALPREYHRDERYDLVGLLREPVYEAFTQMLDRSVTEFPTDRYKDAAAMRDEFQTTLRLLRLEANIPGQHVPQKCIYCRRGTYQDIDPEVRPPDGSTQDITGVAGLARTNTAFRAMVCDYCGNVQTFRIRGEKQRLDPNPWQREGY